jgi:hypothetical protein
MPMQTQTIQIDSTFTSDGEIFPFGPNDTIYGLSISGSVSLLTDTSLVRVILTDNSGNEWMVYEAYPMIVSDSAFDIEEVCDETCYLEEFYPHSLKIQIINAVITISDLSYSLTRYQNLSVLQQEAKRRKELEKVQLMNQYIALKGWQWVANNTSIVEKFYLEKKLMFGNRFNLLGFDFYNGGIYYSPRLFNASIDNSDLTKSFDWRKKHDANLASSFYWDHYPEKYFISGAWRIDSNGWVTRLRSQNGTAACSIFSSIASLSAVTNLYFNRHLDTMYNYWLSERQVFNCTPYHINNVGCDSSEGKDIDLIYKFFTRQDGDGVITDRCYPWRSPYCDGFWTSCDFNDSICEDPDTILFIDHYQRVNLDTVGDKSVFIKRSLIEKGPLTFGLDPYVLGTGQKIAHAVSLVGFETDPETGMINWILKNSWGEYWGILGYYIGPFSFDKIFNDEIYIIGTPISTEPANLFSREKYDADSDGYWNWGIGDRPQDFSCSNYEDWNDNNNRIGPCDSNCIGVSVMPEMVVTRGLILNADTINNGDYFFFEGDTSNNVILNFYISNPGTAQLNLHQYNLNGEGNVSIIYENHPGNYVLTRPDTNIICMDNHWLQYKIKLNHGALPGTLAHIHIYIDEPEFDSTFEYTIVFNGCETSQGYDSVDTDLTWGDSYRSQLKDLHVKMSGKLTITGTVFLSPETDIIVERGGKLIIDGGILTSSCGDLWNGVDIWGNASMPQEPYYQGTVQLLNGGTIEFADTAISTYRTDGTSLIYSGGLIHSTDAFFNNNYVGICLSPYLNPNGGGNRSTFKRTQFITSDKYYKTDNVVRSAPKCGVQMSWVNGINFEGCTFINNSKAEKRRRGTGILNMDADFHVKNACEDDNQIGCEQTISSHFEGLDYGIKSLNVWSFRRLSIESAYFIDNFLGICLSMNLDATLIKNNFEFSADNEYFEPGDTLIGIYTSVCNRYKIEENTFTGADPDHYELVGMHIYNSGEDYNEIYNNAFENVDYGIVAAGKNKNKDGTSGLCIKCNDFTKCQTDVLITPGGYVPELSGIATNQGEKNKPPAQEPDMAAGNTFSEFIGDENNYLNDNSLTTLHYVHHNSGSTSEKVNPEPFTNINPEQDDYASYSKESSCPSNLNRGNLSLSDEQSKLLYENKAISIIKDSLEMLIDGGDTPGFNFEIRTSFPDEALQLHQDLMNISPYLSDTILKSAIERENVLINAMIRDILIANPQAAKSPEILEKLDDRLDPIPDYMMDEIISGRDYYGAKELLLQNLALHNKKQAKSLGNIIWYLKQDSLINQNSDSLIDELLSTDEIDTKYETAFLYLEKQDSISLYSLLNFIPTEYALNTDQQSEYESYLELFNVLPDLLADSCIIDSVLIQRLLDIAEYDNSLPGIYSRNLLDVKNLLSYEEPVFLGNIQLKSNSITTSDKGYEDAKSPYLEIFPNPSNTFFIIKYDLTDFNNPGIILISDQTGKIKKIVSLTDKQDQTIVVTDSFSAGIYLISLYVNSKLESIVKAIIY